MYAITFTKNFVIKPTFSNIFDNEFLNPIELNYQDELNIPH